MQKQHLIHKIENLDNFIVYYDADIFSQSVDVSINLTLQEFGETIYHDDECLEPVEYNTIHDEQIGTNGTSGDLEYQDLSEIAVHFCAKPKKIYINGPQFVDANKEYFWRVDGFGTLAPNHYHN